MVQHEFGQRLSMNHPADVGSLGMTVALDWDVTEHHMVPPHHFSPQPAVQSQVIELRPHNKLFSVDKRLYGKRFILHLNNEERRFVQLSEGAQAYLANQRMACSAWKDAMQSLQIEMMDARPEELTLDDWVQLAEKVEKGSMIN